MKQLTSTRMISGTFIKTTPSEIRRLADVMEEETKKNGQSAVELTTGVVLFVDKDTNYVAESKTVDTESRSH